MGAEFHLLVFKRVSVALAKRPAVLIILCMNNGKFVPHKYVLAINISGVVCGDARCT